MTPTINIIASLATPDDCLLAVIIGKASKPTNDDRMYEALFALAAKFRVPVVTIITDEQSIESRSSVGSGVVLLAPTLADPLANDSILQAINDKNRRKLVLAGVSSEGAVTFMALSALARGFDVHVVEDLCQSSSIRVHQTAMQRLTQAGVVLTTSLQLQTEWSATSVQLAAARQSAM